MYVNDRDASFDQSPGQKAGLAELILSVLTTYFRRFLGQIECISCLLGAQQRESSLLVGIEGVYVGCTIKHCSLLINVMKNILSIIQSGNTDFRGQSSCFNFDSIRQEILVHDEWGMF